ncbi:MAG: repeat-containing protein [Bacteroidetes bacterium]|nr:repeat-containing protein [Bacteroidota bacterium]
MKKLNYLFFFVAAFFLNSCQERVEETYTYKINEPVFMSVSEFRDAVKVSRISQPIHKQGKICFYKDYLFVSEPEKGIHIINNANPSSPKNVGFIEILGNADIAIMNDILYADSYIDLVWFDISNPTLPVLKGRKESVFPEALPPTDNIYGYDYALCSDKSKGVIVNWVLKEKTGTYYRYNSWWGGGMLEDGAYTSNGEKGGANVGVTGSMARFSVYKSYLYTVLNNYMNVFDLQQGAPKVIADSIPVGWNVETIFSYKNNMFLGTPRGMLIFSVSNPEKPEYVSSLSHFYGCDPVVVENDIAYVTVRSGNNCGQNSNELIVVDVSDVKHPKQLVSYSMTNPRGLGIDNGTLFLCDDGLQVYDANPMTMMDKKLAQYKGMNGYDVIPYDKTLMMIADDGIYQYDYTDLKNIKLLSKISIGQ